MRRRTFEAPALAEREKFLADFDELARHVIRPAMEAIVRRLRHNGADGVITDGESVAMHRPRLTLWMSLEGEIVGSPRQDLNPYLQLDVNAEHRRVDVWEGDMWEKEGVTRATLPWDLKDVSTESVIARVVAILERAANHGQAFERAGNV